MDNANNVLNYFKQEIEQIALKEKDTVLLEVDGIISTAVKEYQESAKRDADYAYQKKISEANNQLSRSVAKQNEVKNNKISEKRSAIAAQVFQDAKAKLEAYTKSEVYQQHLLASLRSIKEKMDIGEATLSLNANDMRLEKEIRAIVGDACVMQEKPQIGGYVLEVKKAGVIVDESFDSLLADQEDWFYQNSGLIVK